MNFLKQIVNKLPYVRGLYKQSSLYSKNAYFPPGHFYSVITNLEEIKDDQNRIWDGENYDGLKDINLNAEEQKNIMETISSFYSEIPFTEDKKEGLRYNFSNPYYLHTDGIILYGMLRYLCPKKVIEVGSGYTSALMLDVNDIFFNSDISFSFIEPFTERLDQLIGEKDKASVSILKNRVQDLDLEYFKSLNEHDILFIDSTHVSKCGSDLNFLLFEVLPVLKEGVYIHFHDVFYPFEYPKEWVFKGYNWNENYILRAFLMNNKDYKIQLFAA